MDDEYYTLKEDVIWLSKFIDAGSIFCPCDTDTSSFMLLKPKYNSWKSELYSYDCEEAKQKMRECELTITNPPFSTINKYFETVKENANKYLFIAPKQMLYKKFFIDNIDKDYFVFGTGKHFTHFLRPNGNIESVGCMIVANFKLYENKKIEFNNGKFINGYHLEKHYRVYKNVDNIDKDYKEPFIVSPVSFYLHNHSDLEIIKTGYRWSEKQDNTLNRHGVLVKNK